MSDVLLYRVVVATGNIRHRLQALNPWAKPLTLLGAFERNHHRQTGSQLRIEELRRVFSCL